MPNPQAAKKTLPPPSMWGVRSIRFTAFPDPDTVKYSSTWWLNVVDGPPDLRLNEPKKGRYKDEGEYRDGAKLILTAETGRINWSLDMPPFELSAAPSGFTIIGSFTEILEEFSELMGRWFENEECPNAQRVALGSVLVLPVESKSEGYLQLNKYLADVKIDHEGSSDLQYRINKPRISIIGNERIKINRLSTWAVASMSLGRVEAIFKESQPTLFKEFHACQVELDINTDRHYTGDFSPEMQRKLLEKFKHFALEIMAEGDIP